MTDKNKLKALKKSYGDFRTTIGKANKDAILKKACVSESEIDILLDQLEEGVLSKIGSAAKHTAKFVKDETKKSIEQHGDLATHGINAARHAPLAAAVTAYAGASAVSHAVHTTKQLHKQLRQDAKTAAHTIKTDATRAKDAFHKAKTVVKSKFQKATNEGVEYNITEMENDLVEAVIENLVISESFKAGSFTLTNGETVNLSEDDAKALAEMERTLSPKSQASMIKTAKKSKDGLAELIKFAKAAK